jgi:hypothetical protein
LEERHTHQLPQICKLHGDLIEINKSITERLGGTVLNETWIPSLVVTEGATTTTGFMAMEAMDVANLVAKVAMAISVAKVLVVITRRRRHITLPTLDSRSCPHQGGRLQ